MPEIFYPWPSHQMEKYKIMCKGIELKAGGLGEKYASDI